MRWNCMSKALCFLQITAEHQDCAFFTVFLTIKTLSQNISMTLLQISLKLHGHRDRYWKKKLPYSILEEQFPVPRTTAAIEIGISVISLLWQLRCHCNHHNKFSSFSDTTVVAIFPNLCLWLRSLWSTLGGIDRDKLKPPFKRSKIWGIRFSGCKRLSVFDEEDKLLCLFNCRNCHPFSLLFWFRLVFVLFRFVLF